MRLPDILSALTLNVILALFSMIMAIIALALLAFVLSKENNAAREAPSFHPRDKLKRHESTVVDFKNPSTVPEHFLQLNTLMFQKKPKNNQITEMRVPIDMEKMEKMMSSSDSEEKFRARELPPIPQEEVSTNQVEVERNRRSVEDSSDSPAFVTDSGLSEEYSDSISTQSTDDAMNSISEGSGEWLEGSGWIVEKSTIEPLARKIILDLDCGNEASLC